ncbi:hypothetical protein GOODEAATRI_015770 [Goodea atripinnis]|uniref:Uncharacterized protein n=1 Tax=Goodea atripinnis TaxID=208336 RepID=A0ABV0N3X7_9TELE
MSPDGAGAFKTRRPPPETNGLIGHTTKTLVSLSDSPSGEAMTYPSDIMASTARIKREKHVIWIMNVKGFTACIWMKGQKLWRNDTSVNRNAIFVLSVWLCLK